MSAFGGASNANRNRNNNDSAQQNRNPLMLIHRTLKFMMDTLSMSELNMALNNNYSFIGRHRNGLKSFILNTILGSNDTPMRRHEIAMDYANGFGLFMISQFSSERRDVIRSLTLSHFRNNTPLLIDIILDSNSESIFEQRLIEWISSVFSSWIYKLSLNYEKRLEDVKQLFVQLIMNSIKYLNNNNNDNQNNSNLKIIPEFVSFFVEKGKSFHLQQMQKQHASQRQKTKTNSSSSSSSSFTTNRRNNSNEQWVMNVEESERNRWLETIRCDQKRTKQCLSEMKNHEFSDSYLPPTNAESNKNNNDEQKNKK